MQNRSRHVVLLFVLAVFIYGAVNLFFSNVSVAFADQDITSLLTNVTISGAVQDENGHYQVRPGTEYEISLNFKENGSLQFDETQTLQYKIPDGIIIPNEQAGDRMTTIFYGGEEYNVAFHYSFSTDGWLRITFDQNDPNFSKLERSFITQLNATFKGKFDGTQTEIKFSSTVSKTVEFPEPEPPEAYVTKDARFNEGTGQMEYVITVTADGDCRNVHVTDVVTGDALSIDPSTIQISGNSSTPQGSCNAAGFDYTFPSMADGEVVTITYKANVNFAKDTDHDLKLTFDQLKNTVTAKPENGDTPHSTDYSREIVYKWTDKSDGTVSSTTVDGNKIIDWQIEYNEYALASAAGDTITDEISSGSREYMQYYGDGITVKVYGKNGNLIEARTVPYTSLTTYSASSWTYTIPDSDTQPYRYVISYQTIVDMGKVNQHGSTVYLSNTGNGDGGSIGITPGDKIEVTKSAESFTTEEVTWVSNIHVPQGGLSEAVVTDTFPAVWLISKQVVDDYVNNSLEITGLLPGESYAVTTSGTNLIITFYINAAKTDPGLQAVPGGHTITVKLKTQVDQEWLQAGYDDPGYLLNHTNTIAMNSETATATVTFAEPGIAKTQAAIKNDDGSLKNIQYTLTLRGVSSEPISFTDTFDTSILEVDAGNTVWDNLKIWGGSQYDQSQGQTPVTYAETDNGITITANSVPKQPDGSFYPYYKVKYYLKPKTGVNLHQLAVANGGTYKVTNTVTWSGYSSSSTYEEKYEPLNKEILGDGASTSNRVVTYQIKYNPDKALLNEGNDTVLTDTMNANLSLDYTSVRIVTDPEGVSVPYTVSGSSDGGTIVRYTVPDGIAVTITYNALVVGTGHVNYVNTAAINDYSSTVDEMADYSSDVGGTGGMAKLSIAKVDGYDANKKLSGVQFKIYPETPVPGYPLNKATGEDFVILQTDEDGVLSIDGGDTNLNIFPYRKYFVEELEAPEDYERLGHPYWFTLTDVMADVNYSSPFFIYYISDTFQIKNWPLEGLVIEKKVMSEDITELNRDFYFRVTILNADGLADTSYNEDPFSGGVTTFSLKNNQQKSFYKLTSGTRFLVEEIDEKGNLISNYVVSVSNGENTVPGPTYQGVTGITYTLLKFSNTPAMTAAGATKVWENANGSDTAPEGASVVFTLYADGVATDKTVTLDGKIDTNGETTAWQATFTNLPMYRPGTTTKIVYTVQETTGFPGYTGDADPVPSGGTIKNTQTPGQVTARKLWVNADGSNKPPQDASVVFTLFADGESTGKTVILDGVVESKGKGAD